MKFMQQLIADTNDAWNRYKQGELLSCMALDDDQNIQETTNTSIKTTTTYEELNFVGHFLIVT